MKWSMEQEKTLIIGGMCSRVISWIIVLLYVFEVNFPFWFRIFLGDSKCHTEEFSFVFLFVMTAPTFLFLLLEEKKV